MADRVVESSDVQVPEIPELLEKVLLFTLEEAKEKMLAGQDVIPFTALVVKENLFLENHPGETAEQCFAFARHTVCNARGAQAYALCYDGYIEADDEVKDCLIAEGGLPGEEEGYAVGFLYTVDDEGKPTFESEPAYIGASPNFMEDLKEAEAYAEDEIEERYLDDSCDDEAQFDEVAAESSEELADSE